MIMAATLIAVADMAIRMMNRENDGWVLKIIRRATNSGKFKTGYFSQSKAKCRDQGGAFPGKSP